MITLSLDCKKHWYIFWGDNEIGPSFMQQKWLKKLNFSTLSCRNPRKPLRISSRETMRWEEAAQLLFLKHNKCIFFFFLQSLFLTLLVEVHIIVLRAFIEFSFWIKEIYYWIPINLQFYNFRSSVMLNLIESDKNLIDFILTKHPINFYKFTRLIVAVQLVDSMAQAR